VTRLAQIISNMFHPFSIGFLTMALVSYGASGGAISKTVTWLLLIVTISFLPPAILIAHNARAGRYSDYDVSIRAQRHGLVITSVVALLVLIALLHWLAAPAAILACIYAGLLGLVLGGLINLWVTKVSGHVFSNAYSTAVLLTVQPPFGLLMVGVTVLVSWSRLRLNRHNLRQVLLGWAVGFLCVVLVFQIYLGGYRLP
jgi:membrane-associated phospholipid phosphatase